MINRCSLLLLLFCASLCAPASAQIRLNEDLRSKLEKVATQDVPSDAPGIATAIIQDGQTIFEKYAGFANLTERTPITPKTRFNIASNAKQFTALAVLTLIEEKKLRMSDDIRKFFPDLYPQVTQPITIGHLLTHSSGIRDVYDLWSLQGLTWWEKSFNNRDVLDLIRKQQDLNFTPGSTYAYSNTNYMLLALIVEKVSGKSFVQYTDELFRKLNMPDTSFVDDALKIRGPIAASYFNFGTWTTYNWIWNACGDGNLFSTLTDQIQWEKVIQGKVNVAIPRKIIEKGQRLVDGSRIRNYGYGLEFAEYKTLPCTFHEGSTGAWKATVVRFPKKKLSFLTLTNTGKAIPAMQTRQMVDVVFGLQEDAKYLVTRPARADKFVSDEEILGVYQNDHNFTFQFERREGTLFLKRSGRNDIRLEREADNIFHQANDPDFKQEFKRNAAGEMEVTAYYTSHSPYTLTRKNVDWQGFDYTSLNGRYINSETEVAIEITYRSEKEYEVKMGTDDPTKGLLIAPGRLLVDSYVFDFARKSTTTDSLLLSGDRIQKVRFLRAEVKR